MIKLEVILNQQIVPKFELYLAKRSRHIHIGLKLKNSEEEHEKILTNEKGEWFEDELHFSRK